MRDKHLYNLVELTSGPWRGEVRRSEMMTDEEAKRSNAKMSGTVIEWRKADKR